MTEGIKFDWEFQRAERTRIIKLFSIELASRLGRSDVEITKNGLSAIDFGPSDSISVEIIWEDESQASFNGAFAVMSTDGKRIAVFTEHCGYFILQAAAINTVYENHRQLVFFNQDN